MSRQRQINNSNKNKGVNILMTCENGGQFIILNANKRLLDIVEGHALSSNVLSVEISSIKKVETVSLEISNVDTKIVIDD